MIHSTKPPHEQQVSALYNPSNLNPQGGYREINPAFSHKPSEAKITALPPGILEDSGKLGMLAALSESEIISWCFFHALIKLIFSEVQWLKGLFTH